MPMESSPVIFWFRNDLRIGENPGLSAALADGRPVLPLFIYDEAGEGDWKLGGASKWWLHQSLCRLSEALEELGSGLVIRNGGSQDILTGLCQELGVKKVMWNRRYEPEIIKRDTSIKSGLQEVGIEVESFNGSLLLEPWEVKNKSGNPFKVFTPYWKQCKSQLSENELASTGAANYQHLCDEGRFPESLDVEDLDLLPDIQWDAEFYDHWEPGEAAALKRLKEFTRKAFDDYSTNRDIPSIKGTSRLSPHLHFGEISPVQVWNHLASALPGDEWRHSQYVSEIGWREFAYHLIYHFPDTASKPLRPEFESFPWDNDQEHIRDWQRGMTGYPIVDAGMRELWATGWMHNRVRMIVASFLVKHLLVSWQEGSRWFWDTLVDADLASNSLGWQWAAGCGADAAPYFRIFNPILQGEKFDPEGKYIKRWVPELDKIPVKYLFQPWDLPETLQSALGCRIGEDYPEPIVDHKQARVAALAALDQIKKDKNK